MTATRVRVIRVSALSMFLYSLSSLVPFSLQDEAVDHLHLEPKEVNGEAAEDHCGSCFGAGKEGQCCNSCDDVKRSYSVKGWVVGDDLSNFEQCKDELNVDVINHALPSQESPGLHRSDEHRDTVEKEHISISTSSSETTGISTSTDASGTTEDELKSPLDFETSTKTNEHAAVEDRNEATATNEGLPFNSQPVINIDQFAPLIDGETESATHTRKAQHKNEAGDQNMQNTANPGEERATKSSDNGAAEFNEEHKVDQSGNGTMSDESMVPNILDKDTTSQDSDFHTKPTAGATFQESLSAADKRREQENHDILEKGTSNPGGKFVWVQKPTPTVHEVTDTETPVSKAEFKQPTSETHDDDLIQEEEIVTEYSGTSQNLRYHTDGTPDIAEEKVEATGDSSASDPRRVDAIKEVTESTESPSPNVRLVPEKEASSEHHNTTTSGESSGGNKKMKTPGSLASFFEKVNEKEKQQDPRLPILSTTAEMKPTKTASLSSKTKTVKDPQESLQLGLKADAESCSKTWDQLATDASGRLEEIYKALPGDVVTDDDDLEESDREDQVRKAESSPSGGRVKQTRSVNTEFVEGLDDIDKFFEGVDPPDELDVGAAGTSIQDVLMGQTTKIIIKRVKVGLHYVVKAFKILKERVTLYFSKHEGGLPEWFAEQKDILSSWYAENKDDLPNIMKEHLLTATKWWWKQIQYLSKISQDFINALLEGGVDYDDAIDVDTEDLASGLDALENLKRSRGL